MKRSEGRYPSDLHDNEWKVIRKLIPLQRRGRPRKTSMRELVNAVLYLTTEGCTWRALPKDFPPWKTVYDYFSRWVKLGVWRRVHQALRAEVRLREGKEVAPQIVIIDGQSVRAHYGEERGFDGFKKVRGRKRQVLVDSLGFIVSAKVHRANQSETTRGHQVLEDYPEDLPLPEKILGDFAYARAPFATWVQENWGEDKILCTKGEKEFYRNKEYKLRVRVKKSNLKPMRWIVERTIAWFNNSRRLSRDYEKSVKVSESFLYISQIPMMLRRIYP